MNKAIISLSFISILGVASVAQPPRAPQGGRGPQRDWVKEFDTNNDGKIDAAEFQSAIDSSFAELDKDRDGSLSEIESPRPPRRPADGQLPPMADGMAPRGPEAGRKILPPVFFGGRSDETSAMTKTEFEKRARSVFAEMDKNNDGVISREESRPPRRGEGQPGDRPPLPPNARFISADFRFGDKLVKGQPFSADIVIEDTRRLFDGTTAKKTVRGALYRDSEGRIRREQPLEMIAGTSVAGTYGDPQRLVFISDLLTKTQIFLDLDRKVASKRPLREGRPPRDITREAEGGTKESLGTKTIEGVTVEGTRSSFEIPAGQIGNDKAMQVVTETWFSPDLQMVVMSRHTDPLAGEHVFKLVNIRRSDPPADLFVVPSGFKVEAAPGRGPED